MSGAELLTCTDVLTGAMVSLMVLLGGECRPYFNCFGGCRKALTLCPQEIDAVGQGLDIDFAGFTGCE